MNLRLFLSVSRFNGLSKKAAPLLSIALLYPALLLPNTAAAALMTLDPDQNTIIVLDSTADLCGGDGECARRSTSSASNDLSFAKSVTFPNGNTAFVSAHGVTSATTLKGVASSNSTGFLYISFADQYTVNGMANAPFEITAQMKVDGFISSVPIKFRSITQHRAVGVGVLAEIGKFNREATLEQFRVTTDLSSSTAAQGLLYPSTVSNAPFSIPIDLTAEYSFTKEIGDVFELGFGLYVGAVQGTSDFFSTANIDFILPEGVTLTSALGAQFGAPLPVVGPNPVPNPPTLYLFGVGLLGLAGLAKRMDGKG
ncbi:MAG: hypothetical protein AABY73_04790 [Pseudomonadota bacterium]